VFKNPITDPSKASKKGRITTVKNEVTGEYSVRRINEVADNEIDALVTVFEDGEMKREFTMEEIRTNS
jgi:nicotinamide phosphoribosyltransferase